MLTVGSNQPNIYSIKKNLIKNKSDFLVSNKEELLMLDYRQSWQLTKEVLPKANKLVARNLVRLLYQDKVYFLGSLLKDRDERYLAIECLGYLPSRDTVELLVKLLSNVDDTVQISAAGALKNHTPRLVVPYLIDALIKNTVPAARVGEVLLAMGFLAEEALLDAYPDKPTRVQAQIIEILTISKNPKCELIVAQAIKSNKLILKKKALEAIETFLLKDLWFDVVECLEVSDWSCRAQALKVLGKLDVKEAIEYIVPVTSDEDSWVRECAYECLEKLGFEVNKEI